MKEQTPAQSIFSKQLLQSRAQLCSPGHRRFLQLVSNLKGLLTGRTIKSQKWQKNNSPLSLSLEMRTCTKLPALKHQVHFLRPGLHPYHHPKSPGLHSDLPQPDSAYGIQGDREYSPPSPQPTRFARCSDSCAAHTSFLCQSEIPPELCICCCAD